MLLSQSSKTLVWPDSRQSCNIPLDLNIPFNYVITEQYVKPWCGQIRGKAVTYRWI